MKNELIRAVNKFIYTTEYNYVNEQVAFQKEHIGTRIFEQPLFAFGDVNDSLFLELKKEGAIGNHFRMPLEWNEKGCTVISLFLPFTDILKESNMVDMGYPSELWMNGRIDGQKLCSELGGFIVKYLEGFGYKTVCPTIHESLQISICADENIFTSNWSERHIAFVCGLGTFGLSKGLITEKGIAGRFVSVITEMNVEKTVRKYSELYENCIMCGACVRNCPVNAISHEKGKEHIPCSTFIDEVMKVHSPYYGCGKCQVSVPCMNGIPSKP